jgi:hypothetical protein
MLMYFFAVFKKNLTLSMTKLRVLVLCFSYFIRNEQVKLCVVLRRSSPDSFNAQDISCGFVRGERVLCFVVFYCFATVAKVFL